MDDIMALKPLQTVVPTCRQAHLRDLWDVDKVRLSLGVYMNGSVGIVLLDMRKGKRERRSLDKLSHLPRKTAPTRRLD